MNRRLSKLRSIADWEAMLQEVSTSKGNTLLAMVFVPTEAIFEINRRRTGARSLSMGSSLRLTSQKN